MTRIQECVQLLQTGQLDKAVAGLNQLLAANAKDVEAHQLIGVCFIMLSENKAAEKHLLKALKLNPGHIDAQYNLARLYTELQKFSKSKALLLSVLKKRPTWLQARFALGLAAIGLNESQVARTAFKKVLEAQPNNAEVWFNLGNIAYSEDGFIEAKSSYEQALKVEPNYEQAAIALAGVHYYLDDLNTAVELLKNNIHSNSSSAYVLQLAKFYGLLGDNAKARELSRVAIKKDAKNGEAYRIYCESTPIKTVAELAELERALLLENVDNDSLKSMHYAMSLGLEKCGDYQRAVSYLDTANKLRRSTYKYSSQDTVRQFEKIKRTYSKAALEHNTKYEHSDVKNIFILGMPRSGTSLVEQILTSHGDVTGGGELTIMHEMWRREGFVSDAKFHAQFIKKGAVYWADIANKYQQEIAHLKQDKCWLTDKLPHNFLMLGLIALALPKAKIIHCKRHPVANCLSIYKANFAGGHDYAYNQKELAEYHNLYEDLMDHWHEVLSGRFYEIKYEELTSNQEEETRKLLEYCELPWQDACLAFHKNKRAVKTASAYQVRQSMHTKSVDLWKRYGDGLKPLIDNLYIPEEYQD